MLSLQERRNVAAVTGLLLPCEKAPAKAFCSMGDRWYLVVPLMVTPRFPKPRPFLISEVLILKNISI